MRLSSSRSVAGYVPSANSSHVHAASCQQLLTTAFVFELLLLVHDLLTTIICMILHGRHSSSLRKSPSTEVLRLCHLSDAIPQAEKTTEIIFVGDKGAGKSTLLGQALRHRPEGFQSSDAISAPGQAIRVGVIVISASTAYESDSLTVHAKKWSRALRHDFGWRVPVFCVFTQSDLCPVPLPRIRALEELGIQCLTVSALQGTNTPHLWQLFEQGMPPALIPSARRHHNCLLLLQSAARGRPPRCRRSSCLRAVRVLQAGTRGRLARQRRHAMRAAAHRLQATTRGLLARNFRRDACSAIQHLQAAVRGLAVRGTCRREAHAARTLQSAVRLRLLRLRRHHLARLARAALRRRRTFLASGFVLLVAIVPRVPWCDLASHGAQRIASSWEQNPEVRDLAFGTLVVAALVAVVFFHYILLPLLVHHQQRFRARRRARALVSRESLGPRTVDAACRMYAAFEVRAAAGERSASPRASPRSTRRSREPALPTLLEAESERAGSYYNRCCRTFFYSMWCSVRGGGGCTVYVPGNGK